MKHIYRKLTALAAAAITAVSALSATGLTAEAFYPSYSGPNHSSSLDHMDIDPNEWNDFLAYVNTLPSYARGSVKGAVAHSVEGERYQKLYPCFSRSFLLNQSNANVTITPTLPTSYGTNTTWFCTFDSTVAGVNKLSLLRSNSDKLTVKTVRRGTTENFGLLVEYVMGGTPNKFAARLMNDYYMQHYYLDDLYLDPETFSLNQSTGQYTGKFILEDYYIAGMRLSCSDGRTSFGTPVLKWDGDYEYGTFHTEIPFSGTIPFKTDGTLYFSSAQTCTILNNLKVTYNGCQTPMTTNVFQKSYTKLNNSTYQGYLDGNTLHTAISGTPKNNFLNTKNFVCARTSGNNLYISIGEKNITIPEFQKAYGQQKLDIFLSYGWKDGFAHNTWVQNWLNSHPGTNARVYFYYNATSTYSGKYMCDITSDAFKNKLKQ